MVKIEKIRDAAAVQRYHTARTLRTQTVAEHSYGVAQLVLHLWPYCRCELLRAALNHDLPEHHTGDLPAPVKWANGDLKETLGRIESEYHLSNGTGVKLTEIEIQVLKYADMAELVFWCLEELMLGNQYITDIIERGLDYLGDLIFDEEYIDIEEAADDLHRYLTTQYHRVK